MPEYARPNRRPLPKCDRVTVRFDDLMVYRRFWRPTVKILLGSTGFGSLITGLLFYFIISCAIVQKLTFSSMIIPIALLIGMELASDVSEFILSMTLIEQQTPYEVMFNLGAASLMILLEIVLWQNVVEFYQKYSQTIH